MQLVGTVVHKKRTYKDISCSAELSCCAYLLPLLLGKASFSRVNPSLMVQKRTSYIFYGFLFLRNQSYPFITAMTSLQQNLHHTGF
jgi:hypothetical protein